MRSKMHKKCWKPNDNTWARLPGAIDPARNKRGAGVVNPGAGDVLKTSGLTGTFEQKSTCNLIPIASIP
jgi:hypothetical protein